MGEGEPAWVRDLDELEVKGVAGPLVEQPVVLIAADNRAGAEQERKPPGAPRTASDTLGEFFRGRPRVRIEGAADPDSVHPGRAPPVLRSTFRLVLGRPEDRAVFDLQSDYHRK